MLECSKGSQTCYVRSEYTSRLHTCRHSPSSVNQIYSPAWMTNRIFHRCTVYVNTDVFFIDKILQQYLYNECLIHPWHSNHLGALPLDLLLDVNLLLERRRCHSSCHLVTHSSLLLESNRTPRMLAQWQVWRLRIWLEPMAPYPIHGTMSYICQPTWLSLIFFNGKYGEHNIDIPMDDPMWWCFVQSCLIRGICLVTSPKFPKEVPNSQNKLTVVVVVAVVVVVVVSQGSLKVCLQILAVSGIDIH